MNHFMEMTLIPDIVCSLQFEEAIMACCQSPLHATVEIRKNSYTKNKSVIPLCSGWVYAD
jgi:hypothetical protein